MQGEAGSLHGANAATHQEFLLSPVCGLELNDACEHRLIIQQGKLLVLGVVERLSYWNKVNVGSFFSCQNGGSHLLGPRPRSFLLALS